MRVEVHGPSENVRTRLRCALMVQRGYGRVVGELRQHVPRRDVRASALATPPHDTTVFSLGTLLALAGGRMTPFFSFRAAVAAATSLLAFVSCGGQTGASSDAGSEASSCSGGYLLISCDNGHISADCCPAGSSCATPEGFCDHGDGTCNLGACVDAASVEAGSSDVFCDGGSVYSVCLDGQVGSACCPAGAPCHAAPYCEYDDGTCTSGSCGSCSEGTMCTMCTGTALVTSCLPPGGDCPSPATYCDHGDGTCNFGACAPDAGPVPDGG